MDPEEIIKKYYDPESELYFFLVEHSKMVVQKALATAAKIPHLKPDNRFIFEAAMLHDIGIFLTTLPEIGCNGGRPYICHGHLGREILEKEGLQKHALVCERHVGTGITKEDVEMRKLPLPKRDMLPVSLEEKIICFADKFFSKEGKKTLQREKTIDEIRKSLVKFGPDKVSRFNEWVELFKE
ncbi:MAG: HDIG domain-containing metalloprotein [Bacillota bacterium]